MNKLYVCCAIDNQENPVITYLVDESYENAHERFIGWCNQYNEDLKEENQIYFIDFVDEVTESDDGYFINVTDTAEIDKFE